MRKIILGILLPALMLLAVFAQSGLAQTSTNPLNFSKNYILSGGDYVVGGVGLRGLGDATGFATGTISIPDLNSVPATGVPTGADIVAAFIYWETVEKSHSAFDGQQGFFGPVNSDGSVSSHPITGTVLGNGNAPPSWSSGGCAGASGGTTTLRGYRADVRPFLPLDANGKILANGKYQISLADSGSNGGGTPLTLGASLVLIFRVPAAVSLNAIVLYDGSFAPSNQTLNSTMVQPIQGFYQAAASPMAKMTHIVGDGQPNKQESVLLNTVNLPSLYANAGLPPFPGVYKQNKIDTINGGGSWDNPTWFANNSPINTAVNANDHLETTFVVPSNTGSGCVDWGAVIFSTTVQSTDNDSLLDVWKTKQGYCDAAVNEGVCNVGDPSWVALPGAATPGQGFRDLYVQIDHLESDDFISSGGTLGHSHNLKNAALDMVGQALALHNINLHIDCNNCYPLDPYVIHSARGGNVIGNVIAESSVTCQDNPSATPPLFCEFPGLAVTRWKGDFTFLKNQPLNYPDEMSCDTQTLNGLPGPSCVRRFQHGRKDSYHYVLFGHAFGAATDFWAISNGTSTSIIVDGTSNKATVTTSSPHGLSSGARVTVSGALLTVSVPSLSAPFGQDFGLNGTYPSITITSSMTFTFPVTNVSAGTYNNPALFVSSGPALSISGWSDLPGAHSLITLGLWRSDIPGDDQVGSVLQQAGTFAHEMGHTFGLQHGGGDNTNCKPNYQSVMSYANQVRGIPGFDGIAHVNLSGQVLPNLNEASLNESAGLGFSNGTPPAYRTRWFAPLNFLDSQLNTAVGGRAATRHCDGTPITDGAQMVRVEGPLVPGAIDWNNDGNTTGVGFAQDINFNDNLFNSSGSNRDSPFAGFNDWANLDLRQIGGAPGVFGFSGDVWGTFDNSGPGGSLGLGSGGSLGLGSGGSLGLGSGGSLGLGSGGSLGLGSGGSLGLGSGGVESDFDLANSTVDHPTGLSAMEPPGAHFINLNWSAPGFGQIRTYFIWRANTTNGPISPTNLPVNIGNVPGTPPATAFTDPNVKNGVTYTYFVTAALGADSGPNNGNKSGPSNMQTITINFSKGATGQ